MSKIFISHASEDKDALARPLADALKLAGHDVWYDEYVLTVGDSLRQKIDGGLKTSDFGVVILSQSFFQKDWPQNELDGLFALETKNKKLILPVWLNVTKDEVAQFSPILAGRLAAKAERGLTVIVEELTTAISTSDRTRQVSSPRTGGPALLAVSERLSGEESERKRLFSTFGVQEVTRAAADIASAIFAAIEQANSGDAKNLFSAGKVIGETLLVTGPFGVFFQSDLTGMAINSATSAEYGATMGRSNKQRFPPVDLPAEVLEEMKFKPRMADANGVKWNEETGATSMLTSEEVADRIIERFVGHIEDAKG